MRLPSYPEYQDSGVEWLGKIPTTWSVKRIKQTTYLKGRVGWKGLTSDEYLEDGYAYLVTGTDFSKKFINWNDCHCIEENRYEDDPYIQLRDGDLLITKDGTIGKLALVTGLDRPACLNSGIFLIRPTSSYLTEYMYWVLQSNAFKVFCDLSSLGSTIQHLYQNVFEDFSFPVPSSHEQVGIAKFLDRETAKIDTLIAEQEKLLTLLAEKRQATISHAVTKGLNPDVPMKDSGVEWLGEVPRSWDLKALKRVVTLQRGHDLPSDQRQEGVVPVVSSGGISGYHDLAMSGPTVVTGRYGTIGEFFLIETDCWPLNTALYAVEMYSNAPRYIWYMLQSLSHVFVLNSLKSAVPGVDRNDIHPTMVCIPPLDEQKRIVTFLDMELGKLDILRDHSHRAINLLKERRSALISAAVTGQIDVRNALLEATTA